jgi:putative ABC transport system permease protein
VRLFPLVWAALRRKPLESLLLLAAITCAFTLFGLMVGMQEAARRVLAESRADRLLVNPRYDAPDGLPSALVSQIARFDGVLAVGLRSSVGGYRGEPRESVWVDVVDEGMRDAMPELLPTSAHWQHLLSHPSGVYLGRKVSERLRLRKGDHLVVTALNVKRADGGTAWEFDVLGIVPDEHFRSGNLVLGNYRYVDLQRPPEKRDRGFIVAAMNSPEAGERAAVAIDRYFANSATTTASITFRAAQENMANDGLGIAVMTWGIGSAGLFMVLMLVGNAIAQSVRDRIHEFAVLKALGFRDVQIASLVLTEAALPCVAGAVLGMAVARAVALLPRSALPTSISSAMPEFPLSVWAAVLGLSLLVAILGSSLPAMRLRRMKVPMALVN